MFDVLIRLGLLRLFFLAILIRLLLMPFYFHPDIKTYHFQAQFLKEGVFNIYSYLEEHREDLPIKEEFVYFPLTYLFLGAYQTLATPLLGANFFDWLNDASEGAINRIGVYRYLFILKFPYLILDLIVPFLLIQFFENIAEKKRAFLLWLFNPFSLLIIYIFSNVDIIPLVLSLAALVFFRKNNFILSGILLGLSAGFKAYPLLLLPLLLAFQKDFRKKVILAAGSLLTVALVILPFYSNAFLHSALISGLTTRIAFPGVAIGFNETLMISVVALGFWYLWVFMKEEKRIEELWFNILILFLLLFSTIHYHIQWLLWIIPFVIIAIRKSVNKIIFFWLSLSFLIPLLYDDKSMNFSLLSVISPLYNLLPTLFVIIQKIYDPFLLQSILHSLLFSISLVVIFSNLRMERK